MELKLAAAHTGDATSINDVASILNHACAKNLIQFFYNPYRKLRSERETLLRRSKARAKNMNVHAPDFVPLFYGRKYILLHRNLKIFYGTRALDPAFNIKCETVLKKEARHDLTIN